MSHDYQPYPRNLPGYRAGIGHDPQWPDGDAAASVRLASCFLAMSELAMILTAIAAVIAAGTPGLLAWIKAHQALEQGKLTHLLVNSRLTELLELTRQSAKAEGRLEGVAEQKSKGGA